MIARLCHKASIIKAVVVVVVVVVVVSTAIIITVNVVMAMAIIIVATSTHTHTLSHSTDMAIHMCTYIQTYMHLPVSHITCEM